MNKTILSGAIFCVLGLSAIAQNAGIGTAPLNTKQHEILNSALSPETRQTLQAAMSSVSTADTPHAASPSK
jgi:hypothetical protein